MKIIINGIDIEFDGETITYEKLVELAGEKGYPTAVYSGPRRGDSRRSGEMHVGCDPVVVEPGFIFTVIHTGNA